MTASSQAGVPPLSARRWRRSCLEQRFRMLAGMFPNPPPPPSPPLPQPSPKSSPLPKSVEGSGTLISGTGIAVGEGVVEAMTLAIEEEGAGRFALDLIVDLFLVEFVLVGRTGVVGHDGGGLQEEAGEEDEGEAESDQNDDEEADKDARDGGIAALSAEAFCGVGAKLCVETHGLFGEGLGKRTVYSFWMQGLCKGANGEGGRFLDEIEGNVHDDRIL